MTVVITYLASDNARNRRRARRAAKREQVLADDRLARNIANTIAGCSLRVAKAVSMPSSYREPKEAAPVVKSRRKYHQVLNESGRTIHAVQKIRGKSIPLI